MIDDFIKTPHNRLFNIIIDIIHILFIKIQQIIEPEKPIITITLSLIICFQQTHVTLTLISVITIAPLIAYYSQYSLIIQQKSMGSFSIDVCFILIFANIMRIFFWFCQQFAFNLFIQSFIIIVVQFFIIDACVKVGINGKSGVNGDRSKQGVVAEGNEGRMARFWRWNKLENYIIASVFFAIGICLFTILCQNLQIKTFGPTLGFFALSLQATLGLPQLLQNHKSKSVSGLSVFMIICWFVGDFVKTMYFVVEVQPFQFVLSGTFQLFVDTLILVQIMAYGNAESKVGYKDVQNQYQVQGGAYIHNAK